MMRLEDMTGKTLGHYSITRMLGYGGSSTVYLANDVNLQRAVAIKVFQPKEGETRTFLRRFAHEARILAQLDHPNILPIYDYGQQGRSAYLVVPYLPGGSLRDRLRAHGPFAPATTVQLIMGILKALQYAHERGLIHRDIKPGNMLFKADGTLVLCDFGLVKVFSPDGNILTLQGKTSLSDHGITGTPEYMAPEQIVGQVLPASDIYSVGVALYEMLTGVRPFIADTAMGVLLQHLHEEPRPLRQVNPQVSPRLEAVVMRALNKDPSRRYQRPVELGQALIEAITLDRPAIPASSVWSPPPTPGPVYQPISAPGMQRLSPGGQVGGLAAVTSPVMPPSQIPAEPFPGALSRPVSPISSHDQRFAPPTPAAGQYTTVSLSASPSLPARPRPPLALVAALVLIALVVFGSLGAAAFKLGVFNPHTVAGQAPSVQQGPQHSPTVTTRQVTTITTAQPATTSCPASGASRAAVMPPLKLGSHANIVYITNMFQGNTPLYGILKRYDLATKTITQIVRLANATITEAQVSQDGQWVLFTTNVMGRFELDLVRVDGQHLQTLLCSAHQQAIFGTEWTFDQKVVVFDEGKPSTPPTTYVLAVANGALEAELVPSSNLGYLPRLWISGTRLYLIGYVPDASVPPQNIATQNIYILDTKNGANQHDANLQQVTTTAQSCVSFDSSYDNNNLFLSQCAGGFAVQQGPSSITVQLATGSVQNSIYSSSTLAVTTVRAIAPLTLLLTIENTTGDTSQNGVWEMDTDGTVLHRLTTDSDGTQALCPFSQFAWANLSRDNTLYALQLSNPRTNTYGMAFGALSGGPLTQFDTNQPTPMYLVGWTTF